MPRNLNQKARKESLEKISKFKSAVTTGGNKVKTALFPSLSGSRKYRR